MTKHTNITIRDLLEGDRDVSNALKNLRNNPEDIHLWAVALRAAKRNGMELHLYLRITNSVSRDARVITNVWEHPLNKIGYVTQSIWHGGMDLSDILRHGIRELDILR